jgi:beta-lactam-binding protein with PASTA domain
MNTGLWVFKVRCTVPNVRGLPLARARAALTAADCRTGRVRRVRARARHGRVLAQTPAPGARPRFPAAVQLTVG